VPDGRVLLTKPRKYSGSDEKWCGTYHTWIKHVSHARDEITKTLKQEVGIDAEKTDSVVKFEMKMRGLGDRFLFVYTLALDKNTLIIDKDVLFPMEYMVLPFSKVAEIAKTDQSKNFGSRIFSTYTAEAVAWLDCAGRSSIKHGGYLNG